MSLTVVHILLCICMSEHYGIPHYVVCFKHMQLSPKNKRKHLVSTKEKVKLICICPKYYQFNVAINIKLYQIKININDQGDSLHSFSFFHTDSSLTAHLISDQPHFRCSHGQWLLCWTKQEYTIGSYTIYLMYFMPLHIFISLLNGFF